MRERKTAALALTILRETCRPLPATERQPDSIRLALRVLLPYADAETLSLFWRCADNPNAAQRGLTLRKLLRIMEAQVARAARTGSL